MFEVPEFIKNLLGGNTAQQAADTDLTSNDHRLKLVFKAVVQNGEGMFSNMEFPGKHDLASASDDWPEELFRGSLNCKVTQWPENFEQLAGEGDRIAALDTGYFAPEFRIPREAIINNRVGPYAAYHNPDMGIAQAWKCAVTNEDTGQTFEAWHVRRIDGTYEPFHGIIELMSDKHLRSSYGLENGTPITIEMSSAPIKQFKR